MARNFSGRLMNQEAWAGHGWSDLFHRIFGESGFRVSTTALGVARPLPPAGPSESANRIPTADAFEPFPATAVFGGIPFIAPFDFLAGADASAASAQTAVPLPLAPGGNSLGIFGLVEGQPGGGVAVMAGPLQNGAAGAFASRAPGYQILYSDDLSPGLVVDLSNREIVPDGTRYLDLGTGVGDVLVLAGPLAAPSTLPTGLVGLESVVVLPGASYALITGDDHVAPGATLTVSATGLGADETISFDGSAETDGHFAFFGGGGRDDFRGGGAGDLIYGMGGGDALTGGGGSDVFAYSDAGESSGAGYDSLLDFDPGADRIDLPVSVTGFDAAVETGSLSATSFDEDLLAALGPDGLGAGRALFFAPDGGDLAGTIFLIVDGNGESGYQAGEDFVFALGAGDLADLSGHTGFFV
jgi:Ca2+-binding RTX toxin-like protein